MVAIEMEFDSKDHYNLWSTEFVIGLDTGNEKKASSRNFQIPDYYYWMNRGAIDRGME